MTNPSKSRLSARERVRALPWSTAAALVAGLVTGSCTSALPSQYGTPDHLIFSAQPTVVSAGGTIAPAVQVTIVDAADRAVANATDPVTLAFGATPGSATLSGTLTVAAVGGTARFTDLSVDLAASGYRLVATSGALTAATSDSFTVFPPFTTASAVSAGGATTCGIAPSGAAYCWGHNSVGEVGNGRTGVEPRPVPVVGGHVFASIISGGVFGCGLVAGTLAAYCWGHNAEGELGIPATTLYSTSPVPVSGNLTFRTLSAGGLHSCGIASTTTVAYCWGFNYYGQLGDNTDGDHATPVAVSGGLAFAAVSAGLNHSCGITTPAHFAYCWGDGSSGELGTGSIVNSLVPVAVSGGLTFDSISAGGSHSCALTAAGTAYCWGANANGQLGNASNNSSASPVAVAGGLTFASITAGGTHSCGVVRTSGALYCWGSNGNGELGTGNTTASNVPVAVTGALTVSTVSAGQHYTCALTTTNAAYCWGLNGEGEIGTGTIGGNVLAPTQVMP